MDPKILEEGAEVLEEGLTRIFHAPSAAPCSEPMNTSLGLNFDPLHRIDSLLTALRQNHTSALHHQLRSASRDEVDEVSKISRLSLEEKAPLLDRATVGITAETLSAENSISRTSSATNTSRLEEVNIKAAQATEQAAAAQKASITAYRRCNRWGGLAWGKVVSQMEQAAENWKKVRGLLTQGETARVLKQSIRWKIALIHWRAAAEQSEASAEEWRYVAQVYSLGYISIDEATAQATIFRLKKTAWIALCLSNATTCSLKSKEALENENQSLAVLWSKTAERYEEGAASCRQALEAKFSENSIDVTRCCWDEESDPLCYSAGELYAAAKILEKATMTTAKGNKFISEIVALRTKTVTQHQDLAECYRKRAEVQRNENILKENKEAGRDKKDDCAMKSANILESVSLVLEKATSAAAEGNEPLALLWIQTATRFQETAEYLRKEAEARLTQGVISKVRWEKIADSASWSASQLHSAALALEKSTIAGTEGNQALSTLWNKTATQYQESSEYWRKAADAELNGNANDADCWNRIGLSFVGSANDLNSAASALEKEAAAIALGNEPLAEVWSETAVQYQELAEYKYKVAEARLNRNSIDATRWEKAVVSVRHSVYQLYSASENLEKAINAAAEGNQALATLWSKTAAQYQESAEYGRKEAQAKLKEKSTVEADRWKKLIETATKSAWQFKDAAFSLEKAKNINEEEVSALWMEIVQKDEESAEYYRQATNAELNGNTTEYDRLNKAGDIVKNNTKALTIKAEQTYEEVKIRARITLLAQQAADAKVASQAARDKGNWLESSAWDRVVVQTEQAVQNWQNVNDQEKPWLYFWTGTAEKSEIMAETWRQVAQAYALGDQAKASRLEKTARIAYALSNAEISSCKSEKAIDEVTDDSELAVLWNKIASQHQELIAHYRKVVDAVLSGSILEHTRWDRAATFAMNSDHQLDKATEALFKATSAREKEEGDESQASCDPNQNSSSMQHSSSSPQAVANEISKLTTLWEKTVLQYQESADHWRKAAEAAFSGNDTEANRWNEEAISANSSADALLKSISF